MLEEKSGRSRTRGEGRTYGEAAVAAIRYLRILKVARKFRHGEQRANRQPMVMTVVVVVVPSVNYVCRALIGSHRDSIPVSLCARMLVGIISPCRALSAESCEPWNGKFVQIPTIPGLLYPAPKKIVRQLTEARSRFSRHRLFSLHSLQNSSVTLWWIWFNLHWPKILMFNQ